jgi:hypothetical protein
MAYTNIDDPSAFFQIALHSSSNAATITNDGNSDLQPDLLWSKARGAGHNNALYSSTRGVSEFTIPNTTASVVTSSSGYDLTSFNSDGFSTGNNQYNIICGNTTYVAWQWHVNSGTTSSNTEGNVTNTLQVNQDAGISISKFTSASSGNTTIGHGLGVTPDVFIVLAYLTNAGWWINHKGLTNRTDQYLGLHVAQAAGTVSWGAAPTSTLITLAPAFIGNNTTTVMCYAFAEKQGYSKFGNYVGTGVANNGPFVYLGFKPRFIMIKSTTATGSHVMWDSKRSPFNGMDDYLVAAEADAEGTNGIFTIDAVSNGFKIMNTGANNGTNQAGTKYVYYAFAENPFTTSTGIPTTAR